MTGRYSHFAHSSFSPGGYILVDQWSKIASFILQQRYQRSESPSPSPSHTPRGRHSSKRSHSPSSPPSAYRMMTDSPGRWRQKSRSRSPVLKKQHRSKSPKRSVLISHSKVYQSCIFLSLWNSIIFVTQYGITWRQQVYAVRIETWTYLLYLLLLLQIQILYWLNLNETQHELRQKNMTTDFCIIFVCRSKSERKRSHSRSRSRSPSRHKRKQKKSKRWMTVSVFSFHWQLMFITLKVLICLKKHNYSVAPL